MTTAEASVGETTVTQRLLAAAAARGSRTALLAGIASAGGTTDNWVPAGDAGGAGPVGTALSYPDLAALLLRAAAGLAWRGVRPRDAVGVYVADAASYTLACHAIRAAGAVPTPVSACLSVAEIAGQLADCGARMLVTSPSLAAAGLAAADRSWVRQVISFGEAPGAMPFPALLGLGTLQPTEARARDIALLPYVRRPDGTLAQAGITHLDMAAGLARLHETAVLTDQDIVLAVPPAGDGRGYTALLDHALTCGATVVAPGAGDLAGPGDLTAAARQHQATAAIVPFGAEIRLSPPPRMLVVDC
jgi:acyl-CoA synthetase (AMP-forming)/AMP-acid ligase II